MKRVISIVLVLFFLVGCNTKEEEFVLPSKLPAAYDLVPVKEQEYTLIGGVNKKEYYYYNPLFKLKFDLPPGWNFSETPAKRPFNFIDLDRVDEQLATGNAYLTMYAEGPNNAGTYCIIQDFSNNPEVNPYDIDTLKEYYKQVFSSMEGYGAFTSFGEEEFAGRMQPCLRFEMPYGYGQYRFEMLIFIIREENVVLIAAMASAKDIDVDQIRNLYKYYEKEESEL